MCFTTTMWKCGARVAATQLRRWLSSFSGNRTFGGAPGRIVLDAHLKVLHAVKEGVQELIFQHLSAFFDNVSVEMLVPILQHLHAPTQLLGLIQACYGNPRCLFKHALVAQPQWQGAS